MPRVTLPNSTYLDLTSYHTTTATTVAEAYGLSGAPVPSNMTLNVALVLPRANDPTALLQGNWATRQTSSADARGQRHAVVDLRRRSGRLCRRAGGAHGARHSTPGQCRRQRRLHQLGGIADDLGAADAASFHGPVRQDALWRRSLPPVLGGRSVVARHDRGDRHLVRRPAAVGDLSRHAQRSLRRRRCPSAERTVEHRQRAAGHVQ